MALPELSATRTRKVMHFRLAATIRMSAGDIPSPGSFIDWSHKRAREHNIMRTSLGVEGVKKRVRAAATPMTSTRTSGD